MEVVTGKGARPCHCRAQKSQANRLERARIPVRYRKCSFANYHPAANSGTQLRAYNYAFKLVNEYPVIDRGLLLMGQSASAKHIWQQQFCAGDREGN
jgi:DNA replication protein DnaC